MRESWPTNTKFKEGRVNNVDKGSFLIYFRYHNHLDSNINTQEWTPEEEEILYLRHEEYGNKWSLISKSLKGR